MKIISYNIQAGINSHRPRDYILGAHRQFIHSKKKARTLTQIGKLLSGFDIACLQEVDLGGRRSGFESQTKAILTMSGHDHAISQTNRLIGKTSQHGNVIFSRYPITDVEDHKLPGKIQGRGVLICHTKGYTIANTHLSLGPVDQTLQFEFLKDVLSDKKNIILVGDLNCRSHSPHLEQFAEHLDLDILTHPGTKTFPAWNPKRDLDHIIVSQEYSMGKVNVGNVRLSDHRPVTLDLTGHHHA